jgi:dolichol-phosphate mannosyltransferase
MKLCVVIPMYDEERIARGSLETILPYARALPVETTVLVVNDCSRDRTEEIVRAVIAEQPDDRLRLVSHERNGGYGSANRTGIRFAIENGYDYVLFMDSDLTNHPKYLLEFCRRMEAGDDYIKATRYAKGGGFSGVPWRRRMVSRAGNLVARLATGLPITDITNGFRAVKTDVLRKLDLKEDHFSLIVEELMKARRHVRSMSEVPNILGTRAGDAKGTAFRYDLKTYWKYFKYLFVR